MPESAETRWRRIIHASVSECLQTWQLQARSGPVTAKAREAILARATVLVLRRFEGHPPEIVVALLPSLVRAMLEAFVEVVTEGRGKV
jgi:hypothetical protein